MAITIPDGYGEVALTLRNENSARLEAITFGMQVDVDTVQTNDLWSSTIHAFAEAILQDATSSIHCSGGTVTFFNGAGHTGSVPFSIAQVDGAASGDTMTPNVAYLYQKQSIVLGRSGRGRFFLPGVSESHVDGGGNVDPTFLTAQRNHATSALAGLADAGGMFILSKDGPVPVTKLVPEAMVATQRRRLRK